MNIQTDIDKLESKIRQLKIQYDMFFAGAIPKQPYDLKKEVENLIKRHTNSPRLSYAQRFHFNALISRYNSYAELWSKILRDLEEKGKSPVFVQKPDRPPVRKKDESSVVAAEIFTDKPDIEKTRALHSKYVEARKAAGESDVKVSFESFARQIAHQADRMREKTKCTTIEVRIIAKDSKVILTAKALQEET